MADKTLFRGTGFQLTIFTHWLVQSANGIQALIVEPTPPEQPAASLVVAVRLVTEDVTLQSVTEATQQEQQKSYPKYEVLAMGETSLNEQTAALLHYTWLSPQTNNVVTQQQYFLLHGDYLYGLTGTYHPVTAPSIINELENMLQSFTLMPVTYT